MSGKVVGTFAADLPPGVESPFIDEQLAEFCKQRAGRPLGNEYEVIGDDKRAVVQAVWAAG